MKPTSLSDLVKEFGRAYPHEVSRDFSDLLLDTARHEWLVEHYGEAALFLDDLKEWVFDPKGAWFCTHQTYRFKDHVHALHFKLAFG